MPEALSLAWRQLLREKARSLVAVAGITFAAIMMFLQVGFADALYWSAVAVLSRARAEVIMVHPSYEYTLQRPAFSRRSLQRALAHEDVVSVAPVMVEAASWRNPETNQASTALVIAVQPDRQGFELPGLTADPRNALLHPEAVLYDELSWEKFGPVGEMYRRGETVEVEVNGFRIRVTGLFSLGTSFVADGTIVTSDQGFLRLFPGHRQGVIHLGLIRLRPGADAAAVARALDADSTLDTKVLTKAEFLELERSFWQENSPIGFIFGLGAAMGFVVGLVVVYQILYADVADHLSEYATLKAIGYGNGFLSAVVVAEASILAVVSLPPAVLIAHGLFIAARDATSLPMAITAYRASTIFGLILVMCTISGLLAMRKVASADPADVY